MKMPISPTAPAVYVLERDGQAVHLLHRWLVGDPDNGKQYAKYENEINRLAFDVAYANSLQCHVWLDILLDPLISSVEDRITFAHVCDGDELCIVMVYFITDRSFVLII